ncbi:MAG: CpaF family protein [Actinobacteria bacterium]|nr:CpaF family protein [Actinomycetota bacterium]
MTPQLRESWTRACSLPAFRVASSELFGWRHERLAAVITDEQTARTRVHSRLLQEVGPSDTVTAERVAELIRDEFPLLPNARATVLADEVLADVHGLGPLEPVLSMPDVTDVLVNGPGPVWIEQGGRLRPLELDLDAPTIRHLVERVVAPLGLRADRSAPLVDARLPDGSRVHVVMPPLAVDGPYLTIRRFAARPVPLHRFCPAGVESLLGWAVEARMNVVVAGGTGSGKTTLLNALAGRIGHDERIVTVEDAAELRLAQPHVVRLESRPANAEGSGEIKTRELVRNALRMRPDRIVVGEVRGAEALDMLQAMNTGHDGSLSTIHANGPTDALRRLETLVLMADVDLPLTAVREQVRAAVDLVVQLRRGPDGERMICEVAEVPMPGAAELGSSTRALAGPDGAWRSPLRPVRSPYAGAPPSFEKLAS